MHSLPVNLSAARFECTFGRGCDGVCCREGRPLVYADEVERIGGIVERLLPVLRPEAAAAIRRRGWLSNQRKHGERVVRNAGGWCVFFANGCTLHRAGLEDGDAFRYKPAVCALFPIQRNARGDWYVRQKGVEGEKWDLFCLDPASTTARAADTLGAEIALASRFDATSDPPRRS
jgi:hypothetical protein